MSRLDEVEASIRWIMSAGLTGGAITPNMRDLARTLAAEVDELREENIRLDRKRFENVHAARRFLSKLRSASAEVDARDEVIGRLLDLLLPGVAPPHAPCGCVECERYEINEGRYRRACEIAGRTE